MVQTTARGAVEQVADGYWVARHQPTRFALEGIGLGIGELVFGHGACALVHLSAARTLGGVPRYLGLALISAPIT
jgi:hypothetical protein